MWFQEELGVTMVIINCTTCVNNNPTAVRNVLAEESCYYLTPDLLGETLTKGNK